MSDNIKKLPESAGETAQEALEAAAMTANAPESESAAEDSVGVYTHKFRKPFTYEGKTYEKLEFNFERLTGRDMVAIETEMSDNNEYALAPEISRIFQAKMAARAAGVGGDVLGAMPIVDFNKITNACRRFLLDTGF